MSPRSAAANPFFSAAANRQIPTSSSSESNEVIPSPFTDEEQSEPVFAEQRAGPSSVDSSNPFLAARPTLGLAAKNVQHKATRLAYSVVVAGRQQQLQQQQQQQQHQMMGATSCSGGLSSQSQQQQIRKPPQLPSLSANPFLKALAKVERQADLEGDIEVRAHQDDKQDLDTRNEAQFSFSMVAQHPPASSGASLGQTSTSPSSVNPFSSAGNNRTLHLKGVPREINNEQILRQHFERFGEVESIKCHPAKMFAQVTLTTRVSCVTCTCT